MYIYINSYINYYLFIYVYLYLYKFKTIYVATTIYNQAN